jgi:hypothetical protein
MRADWEFEIGPDAPVIDAAWPGLVDLRRDPDHICEIGEFALVPALAPALLRLNGASSPVWTSKCDVWTPESFDPDELDAPAGQTACAIACYIDLLPVVPDAWSTVAQVEAFCRSLCARLGSVPARCCRADLVVRRAVLAAEAESLGITAYLAGCGATSGQAASAISAALSALADSLCPMSPREDVRSG